MSDNSSVVATTAANNVAAVKENKDEGWLDGVFQWISTNLHRFFYDLGVYVDANARKVIWITVAVTVVCGFGFVRLESESRPEKLFTPQDSAAITDQTWVRSTFPATQRFIALYAENVKPDTTDENTNLLSNGKDVIRDLFTVYEKMDTGVIGVSPNTLSDLCVKNAINTCSISSPLAFWNYDRSVFEADADWIATISATSASDCCSVQATIVPDNVLGGVKRDNSNRITEVMAFKTQWIIMETLNYETRKDLAAESLEEAFFIYMENFTPTGGEGETLIPYNRFIESKAIGATFAKDGILTFISYVLITVFTSWILADSKNPVFSRAKLAPLTVLVVCMSIITSFGIVIACGVKFNPVVNSVIFVLLGVGVDDSLVVIESHDKELQKGTKPRLRIPNALATAGSSITLTSITDFAAFLSGATTIIPAIRIFCIFAATAVIIDFFMQVTCFVAFLRQDDDRITEGRPACDCSCCGIKLSICLPAFAKIGPCENCGSTAHMGGGNVNERQIISTHEENGDTDIDTGTGVELSDMNKQSSVVIADDSTATASAVDTIDPDSEQQQSLTQENYIKDTFSRRIITKYLPNIILNPWGKVGVFVFTIGLLVTASIGIHRLQLDFQASWFLPDGTSAKNAINLSQKYFTGENLPVYMYTKNVDYYTNRADMLSLCQSFSDNKYVVSTSVNCWFHKWNIDTSGSALSGYGSESAFYSNLITYLSPGQQGEQFVSYIKWDNPSAPTKVIATKIFATFEKANSANENIDAMESVRTTAEVYSATTSLSSVAFSEPFVFWEGLKICYSETVRNVAVTLLVVYIVCIFFLTSVWAATLCAMNIILVDFCLFGFLHWFGMHMNTVIAINLIMALGLTVDYSAHLIHAYMHVDGIDKNARMRAAYDKIGVSIFNGGATTFVAVFALVGANSYVFDSFFRCFVLIISFGLYFGMIFLPVVLTLVGPDKVFHNEIIALEDENEGASLVVSGSAQKVVIHEIEKE